MEIQFFLWKTSIVTCRVTNFLPKLMDMLLFSMEKTEFPFLVFPYFRVMLTDPSNMKLKLLDKATECANEKKPESRIVTVQENESDIRGLDCFWQQAGQATRSDLGMEWMTLVRKRLFWMEIQQLFFQMNLCGVFFLHFGFLFIQVHSFCLLPRHLSPAQTPRGQRNFDQAWNDLIAYCLATKWQVHPQVSLLIQEGFGSLGKCSQMSENTICNGGALWANFLLCRPHDSTRIQFRSCMRAQTTKSQVQTWGPPHCFITYPAWHSWWKTVSFKNWVRETEGT